MNKDKKITHQDNKKIILMSKNEKNRICFSTSGIKIKAEKIEFK